MKLKSLLVVITFSFCLLNVNAQLKVNACGYIIPPKSKSLKNSFKSVYEAADIVKLMLDSVKWKENFKIKEQPNIQNAYATIINQMRYIVYDNEFLESLDTYAATKWASISVLAHEIGHHYYNHVIKNQGSNIPSELEADKFSGYVMQRLGATAEQAKAAMEKIGTPNATATHPAKKDRLTAIAAGFDMAQKQMGGTTTAGNGNTNPGGTPTTGTGGNTGTNPNTNTDPNTDPSWIALYMQSNKAETVQLSDDGRTYQPAEIKAGEPFVFKFEVYNYGWLRLKYYNGYRTFKLMHGKDYNILWNRRTKNWTVVEVPE
ncbi:MAG: M48 family metalloprotease [Chitinophagaceae bacterium]|nr:M48 family metalloprotease [Chitinophagaceae bacterium]